MIIKSDMTKSQKIYLKSGQWLFEEIIFDPLSLIINFILIVVYYALR